MIAMVPLLCEDDDRLCSVGFLYLVRLSFTMIAYALWEVSKLIVEGKLGSITFVDVTNGCFIRRIDTLAIWIKVLWLPPRLILYLQRKSAVCSQGH
jgi:hypothetical protein